MQRKTAKSKEAGHQYLLRNSEKNKTQKPKRAISVKITEIALLVFGGDGGIRTHVPRKANAFRVRPVMTTSIRLHIFTLIYYTIMMAFIQVLSCFLLCFLAVKSLQQSC